MIIDSSYFYPIFGHPPIFRLRDIEYRNEFLKTDSLTISDLNEIVERRDTLEQKERLFLQLQWLRDAGFPDVDVIDKNRTFIVTVEKKQSKWYFSKIVFLCCIFHSNFIDPAVFSHIIC